MNNEDYGIDTVVLTDDEGNEQEFEILDTYEEDDNLYYALTPVLNTPEDMLSGSGELVVLQSVEEDGEELLATIDDEDEYERIGNIFLTRFEEEYDDEEEE
ncbi:MAG: DUF1292 domain-containing protein [Oscillospiraceae bacterium]|nr:DUF1292 domain-containing protein [Oscillospiraceae bacterium]